MFPLMLEVFAIDEESNLQDNNEIILSESDLILTFSIAIAVVIGIFLYLARNQILRRKGDYEKGEFESKRNRDFEKYHSDWTSDQNDFSEHEKNTKDDENFRKLLQNSSLPNYYQILGVKKNASQKEIKNEFRRLVKEWHPDKRKDASSEEKMAEINKAYEILSDNERRKKYDSYLNTK